MPKSIIEERLDAVWADVTAAVSEGLVADEKRALADMVPIVAKKPGSATWLAPRTPWVTTGRLRLRESARPKTVIDYEFRLRIDYDALASPDTAQITTWAATARAFELLDVLGRLAAGGRALDCDVRTLRDAAPSGGWGQVRCVTFQLDAAIVTSLASVKQLGWDGPIPLEQGLPRAPWANCLLLRKGGGPHLRRTAGLTLGWLPAPAGAVDLVLAEEFEIVNAGRQTVATIRLVPGLQRPRSLIVPRDSRASSERAGLLPYLKGVGAQVWRELQRRYR
jgi:hypothetical protein